MRRARERAQAGLPREVPMPPPPRIPSQPNGQLGAPRSAPIPPTGRGRQQPFIVAPSASRNPPPPRTNTSAVGVTISNPTPISQWPLAEGNTLPAPQYVPDNRDYRPPVGREQAPQRPPRPSQVPSGFDPSQNPYRSPIRAYPPQNLTPSPNLQDWDQESFYSQPVTTPRTPQSRASTTSSVGSIPDFPVPAMPTLPLPLPLPLPRRSANLGPPPSSRRGVSSYYSQQFYASPIPEESPRSTISRSRGSYASSAAMPIGWAPDSPGYYSGDNGLSDTETMEEGARNSGGEGDGEERGLVRKASLGTRQRPSLVNTRRSTERSMTDSRSAVASVARAQDPQSGTNSREANMGAFGMTEVETARTPDPGFVFGDLRRSPAAAMALSPDQHESVWPVHDDALTANADAVSFRRRRIDAVESPTFREPLSPYPDSLPVDPETPIETRMSRMLEAHQAASSNLALPSTSPSPAPSQPERGSRSLSSRLSAMRRPPRLDIEKVREAEARGSLTSLPDLIRRATQLVAMIDGGRRPASRYSPGGFSGLGGPDGSAERSEESIGMTGTNTTGDTDGEFSSFRLSVPNYEDCGGMGARRRRSFVWRWERI